MILTTLHPVLTVLIYAILVLLATLRVTRFVTTDTLGDWLIRTPLGRWAAYHEDLTRNARRQAIVEMYAAHPVLTDRSRRYLEAKADELDDPEAWVSWQGRLVSGLYCPHCVGFWIGALAVVLTVVLLPLPVIGLIWTVLLAIFALSYLVGHMSARLD